MNHHSLWGWQASCGSVAVAAGAADGDDTVAAAVVEATSCGAYQGEGLDWGGHCDAANESCTLLLSRCLEEKVIVQCLHIWRTF